MLVLILDMGLNEPCVGPTKKKKSNLVGSSPNIDSFSKFFYVLN